MLLRTISSRGAILRSAPTTRRCRPFAASAAPPSDGYRLNINKALDKAVEQKSFREIAKLPPGNLQGLKLGKADDMLKAFDIHTIADLGSWKHFRAAKAIASLAKAEQAGHRAPGNLQNINKAVDQAYEKSSFAELLVAPPSALQGLAPWTDSALKDLGIASVKDLAKWKYAVWADAIVTLAEFENEDFSSR